MASVRKLPQRGYDRIRIFQQPADLIDQPGNCWNILFGKGLSAGLKVGGNGGKGLSEFMGDDGAESTDGSAAVGGAERIRALFTIGQTWGFYIRETCILSRHARPAPMAGVKHLHIVQAPTFRIAFCSIRRLCG